MFLLVSLTQQNNDKFLLVVNITITDLSMLYFIPLNSFYYVSFASHIDNLKTLKGILIGEEKKIKEQIQFKTN